MPVIFLSLAAALLGLIVSLCSFQFLWWQSVILFLGIYLGGQILFILYMCIISLFADPQKPLKKQLPIYRTACSVGSSFILFYARTRVIVRGKEKIPQKGRFLYISNHRSSYDPLSVFAALYPYNLAFISKPENITAPIWGKIAYADGCLAIDRDNNRNALKTILQAADYLSRDMCSIGVYPEGTRSKTGELLSFRAGCFKIAQKAKVPVVIAATHGSELITKHFPLKRTAVYLDILETIPAETVCSMSTADLAEYARNKVSEFLSEVEKENGLLC